MKYVRFVVGLNKDTPRKTGVITELRMLLDNEDLAAYDREYIAAFFKQFNEALPCPPFAQSDWPDDAISWFKESAQEFIGMFRDIIPLLEEHGRFVRMLVTRSPGKILYEDSYQIVSVSDYF